MGFVRGLCWGLSRVWGGQGNDVRQRIETFTWGSFDWPKRTSSGAMAIQVSEEGNNKKTRRHVRESVWEVTPEGPRKGPSRDFSKAR